MNRLFQRRASILLLFLAIPCSCLAQQFTELPKKNSSRSSYEFEVQRDWLAMPDGIRLSVTYFKPIPTKANTGSTVN